MEVHIDEGSDWKLLFIFRKSLLHSDLNHVCRAFIEQTGMYVS